MSNELESSAKLLRIFIGELDKVRHRPLYEALVFAAKENAIAGATVLRGVLSFGASSRIHTAKLLEMSHDLPMIVEIVDSEEKIDPFLAVANDLIEESGGGALVTIEDLRVIRYRPRNS